jgi:hypothetical protein
VGRRMASWTWEQRQVAAETAYAILDEAGQIVDAGGELTLEQERDLEVARIFAAHYERDGQQKKTWALG